MSIKLSLRDRESLESFTQYLSLDFQGRFKPQLYRELQIIQCHEFEQIFRTNRFKDLIWDYAAKTHENIDNAVDEVYEFAEAWKIYKFGNKQDKLYQKHVSKLKGKYASIYVEILKLEDEIRVMKDAIASD